MSGNKFKVGDLVKWSKDNPGKDNNTYYVTEVLPFGQIKLQILSGEFSGEHLFGPWNSYQFDYYPLTYATSKSSVANVQAKERKFNVGDKVTFKSNDKYVYQVAGLLPEGRIKIKDTDKMKYPYQTAYKEDQFNLYVEPRKFKVGDRVLWAEQSHEVEEGLSYVVEELLPDNKVSIERFGERKFFGGSQIWKEDFFIPYKEPEPVMVYWHTLPIGTLVKIRGNGTALVAYRHLICLDNPSLTWAPFLNVDGEMDGSFEVEVLSKDTTFTLTQV